MEITGDEGKSLDPCGRAEVLFGLRFALAGEGDVISQY